MTPLAPQERCASLDILRGMALFGALTVNLPGAFRIPFSAQIPGAGAVETPVSALIECRAFSIISFLFGAGAAVRAERAETPPAGLWSDPHAAGVERRHPRSLRSVRAAADSGALAAGCAARRRWRARDRRAVLRSASSAISFPRSSPGAGGRSVAHLRARHAR